jgi:hypothetical protein
MVCKFESFYELDIKLDEEVKAFGKVYETKPKEDHRNLVDASRIKKTDFGS